ncbi:MAG: FtsQ-type POTRA domain-containing protein [Brasilonema octagenarum HA4186-MV1]|jgi:cell division protein FtsQ|uniref:Cell division protein FtsQ/DivIB n=2 Tax=Brasilonema TaxID=383614 RepID=A0A856MQ05_9CYAN|nr:MULTISPECIES: FtsQ-type POTRA domain-containing protein [Brasilonema]MBW4629196.1 FtsQ-type POTRA domain-containing protein [Brasilonema octagenarum HA4186-MV1]NMF65279.1 cell division protein FtsQ/DivIB [Brasilonema octagenarum UFV-OR1]QDL11661.1 cell division protein FtsQ/DivIB [Brasilonema sennae CENA114]QDL18041.1 cell division protein FtsQ/DivIB [Brasilonema octagenarum UFV-E1]
MAGIISVSRSDLKGRRKKLRQKRQIKIIQTIWQTITVSSLAGGLLWTAIQPIWVLKTPQDIEVSGNHLLSSEAIESLLVLSYPQSLWRIEPHRIAESLKQQPMIVQAIVNRRLFPPGLIVQIQERVPVAIAQSRRDQGNSDTDHKKISVGLLDVNGVWIPIEKYTSGDPSLQLPSLKVFGSLEQYQPYWTELYQALGQSSVNVKEIDFQDPTNLILKTELGSIHLGAPNSLLSEKIKVMAQMRNLPAQLNRSQIDYIDLKNPDHPLVQMNQNNNSLTAQQVSKKI